MCLQQVPSAHSPTESFSDDTICLIRLLDAVSWTAFYFGSVGTENLIQLCAGLNHSKTVQFIFCHSHIPWLATTRTNLDERNAVMFLRQCSLLRLFLILAQSFFSDQICITYVVWFVSGWRTSFFWRPTFGRFVFLGDPGENEKERHDAAFKTKISTIKCH